MGRAVVKIDGVEEGIIGEKSLDLISDTRKLKKASRSYKSLLFYKYNLDESKTHTMTIEVTEGSITLAAILTHQMVVKWNTDDERYPTIMKTEFYKNPPRITDWTTPAKGFDFNSLVPNEYQLPDDLPIEEPDDEKPNPPETIEEKPNPPEIPEEKPTSPPTEIHENDPTINPTDDINEKETTINEESTENDNNDDNNSNSNNNNDNKSQLIGTGGIVGIVIAFIAVIVLSSGTVIFLYKKKYLCFNTRRNPSEFSGLDNETIINDDDI